MIPKNIRKEHVIKAIEEIESSEIPAIRNSKRFVLKYKGKGYPPKYLISIANKYANNKSLSSEDFSGDLETNSFLENLGFKIDGKPKGKRESYREPARKRRDSLPRRAIIKDVQNAKIQ